MWKYGDLNKVWVSSAPLEAYTVIFMHCVCDVKENNGNIRITDMSSSSDNRQRVFLTLARTFSKEAGLTSEKQIRKTSWVWGRAHEKQQWLKLNNWTIWNSSVCNEISQWTWRDQSELCRLQLRVSSTSSSQRVLGTEASLLQGQRAHTRAPFTSCTRPSDSV